MKKSVKVLFCSISGLVLGSTAFGSAWNEINAPSKLNDDFHPVNYSAKLSDLPLSGSVENEHIPWSDSYWPKNRGGAAYRWKQYATEDARQDLTPEEAEQMFMSYYTPTPDDLLRMSQEQLDQLSPAEKYDIYRGKFNYPLVKDYLNRRGIVGKTIFKVQTGNKMRNSKNDAYWEGYCNAWSAVSLHYPEPKPVSKTVMIKGRNITLNFGSGDIKALMVSSYAESLGKNPMMGAFCKQTLSFPVPKFIDGKEVFTQYPSTDGLMVNDYSVYVKKFQSDVKRLGYNPVAEVNVNDPNLAEKLTNTLNNDLNCLDTNAGAFHIVMANQLGLMKEGFVIDKTTDLEIWNQPVFKFSSKVIGPTTLSAKKASTAVSAVQVKTTIYYADDTDYGWTYWNPTLTSLFRTDTSFMEEYTRYQRLLIKQGDEDEVLEYPNHVIGKAHYIYNLELDNRGSIVGGEWLTFDRPDVAWIPRKFKFEGKFKSLNSLYEPVQFPTDAIPNFGDEE